MADGRRDARENHQIDWRTTLPLTDDAASRLSRMVVLPGPAGVQHRPGEYRTGGSAMTPLTLLVGALLGAFVIGLAGWTGYWLTGLRYSRPPLEWGLDDIQVRVVTVGDAPGLIQQTVDALPEGIGSVSVVSERPLDIEGATVRVVPESFETTAIGKARALEWARRTLACPEEYVLFLDEDTQVTGLNGLPDADIVQFAEQPQPNGSVLSWLTEVFRVGTGVERAGFATLAPIYAWGGGLAVRASVEDAVGWDRHTIGEDSAFVRAAVRAGHSYAVDMTRFRTQAPPNLRELVAQRRRWVSARFREVRRLPAGYGALVLAHTVFMLLSTVAVPLAVAGVLLAPTAPVVGVLAAVIAGYLLLWSVLGWWQFDAGIEWLPVQLLALPVTSVANGLGHVLAAIAPVREFRPTSKTDVDAADRPSDD